MAFYCPNCGTSLGDGARFCSSCGKAVAAPGAPAGYARMPLVRPRVGRKIAGVCQGLANAYGWDTTLVRVIAVLLAVVLFPIGLIAYAIFWLIVPEESLAMQPTNTVQTSGV